MTARRASTDVTDSGWYKDAIIYELHVRAFADSDGDGIGDFRGLIDRLDYLQGLGITAIWLLPFFPSPLKDDGYDISDYTAVHPAYGTLDDFQRFVDEAHRRNLRVIIELVLNHTSDQHPWFQRARSALPGSPERGFYVWSDSPERYRDTRVIFQDYEQSNWTWDSTANAYFWHRFYSHQPDLNYDHEPVRQAVFEAVDFWLERGVDGLRLDAVPYLAEQEGTASENLPDTHRFLKRLRAHIDERHPDRMLLAEANQWPEDAVAYFGDDDECHMAFHFPLMPRLFMALHTEDRLPVQDIMAQTPEIPERSQWALFLRNHDELTLEMVTDEERLSMYQAFAPSEEARVNLGIRRRLAPLMGNSRRRIELMNALLCSLPGTPVIYYGDEIGMGDNIYLGDRDSVRTPMQWSADRNAGFSSASPQRLYLPLIVDYEYHHQAVHVEAQEVNPHSLLAFMKRLLEIRKRSHAFGRGTLRFLHPANHRILAFVREYGDDRILVVANLSRFSQAVELDLSDHEGQTPIEVFGRVPFWKIEDSRYPLTLGPHAFYWFRLSDAVAATSGSATSEEPSIPTIAVAGNWEGVITGNGRAEVQRILMSYMANHDSFRGTSSTILSVTLLDAVAMPDQPQWIVPVRTTYSDHDPIHYLLALTFIPAEDDRQARAIAPIARVRSATDGDALLVDAIQEGSIDDALRWIASDEREPLRGSMGDIAIELAGDRERIAPTSERPVDSVVSTTSDAPGHNVVIQTEHMVIKFLRRIYEGVNPEWEIGMALTAQGFPHAPEVLGSVEYRRPHHRPVTIAVLQRHVPNRGHAWDDTVRFLDDFTEHAMAQGVVVPQTPSLTATEILAAIDGAPPEPLVAGLDPYLTFARMLGQRTAELHRALASVPVRPDFAPEPYTQLDQRSLYQSMRRLAARVLRTLQQAHPRLEGEKRRLADTILAGEAQLYAVFRRILDQPRPGFRIRCHGDLHLGQVLLTEDDVVFADFEGEPDKFIEERRLKLSPLRDVATMLHSFQLGARHGIERHRVTSDLPAEQAPALAALVDSWCLHSSAAFLDGYQREAGEDGWLPTTQEACTVMIDLLLLERAIRDVERELLYSDDMSAPSMERLALLLEHVPQS